MVFVFWVSEWDLAEAGFRWQMDKRLDQCFGEGKTKREEPLRLQSVGKS